MNEWQQIQAEDQRADEEQRQKDILDALRDEVDELENDK